MVVKIPKIKVCNPFPFRKTSFATSLKKRCHMLFEITFHVVCFSLSHICSSLFRSADGSKPFEIAFTKICIFNWIQNHQQLLSGLSCALFLTTFLEIAVFKSNKRALLFLISERKSGIIINYHNYISCLEIVFYPYFIQSWISS